MYRHFNEAQEQALREAVTGRLVHDLGADDLYLAYKLVALGAGGVVAVDRNPMPAPADARIRTVVSHFDAYEATVATAFLAWPVNWPCGLPRLIADAERVIYLGKNTDGSMCGSRDLWTHLLGREVTAYVSDRRNTLIVYGHEPRSEDKAYPEERAAASINVRLWRYEDSLTSFPGPW